MNTIIKCKLFVVNEEDGKLIPRSVMFSDEISERYNLKEDVFKFMINELRDYGRYWLNDNEVVSVFKE